MWIVIANRGLSSHRDFHISSIIGDNTEEKYIYKNSTMWSASQLIMYSKIFQNESRAIKFINDFERSKFSDRKFKWISDYHLSYRKLEKFEWNQIIDYKINILTNKYNSSLNKLKSKRLI
jgi:hypothetical protein